MQESHSSVSQEELSQAHAALERQFGIRVARDLEVADSERPRGDWARFMLRGYYCNVTVNHLNGKPFLTMIKTSGELVRIHSVREFHVYMDLADDTVPRSPKWKKLDDVVFAILATLGGMERLTRFLLDSIPHLAGERVQWRGRYWKLEDGQLYSTLTLHDDKWYRFQGWK